MSDCSRSRHWAVEEIQDQTCLINDYQVDELLSPAVVYTFRRYLSRVSLIGIATASICGPSQLKVDQLMSKALQAQELESSKRHPSTTSSPSFSDVALAKSIITRVKVLWFDHSQTF